MNHLPFLFYQHTNMIYKLFAGVMLSCILITGCSKTKTAVAVQEEAPAAIKALIKDYQAINVSDCGCHPFIKQYIWRNENVYMLGYNGALNVGFVCDWLPLFYNAAGQQFEIDGANSYQRYQDFLRDSQFIKTVWACE